MNLRRLDVVGLVPLLLLALLLTAGGVLSAQEDRGARAESSDAGPVVEPRMEPDPPPAEPPAETPSEPSAGTPSEPTDDTPGRYAVPVSETPAPHRQPPSRDRNPGPRPGGGDGYIEEDPVETYDDPSGLLPGDPYGDGDQNALGAIDLDVSPGRTEVYVDGHYFGIVDQFDGWPSYLWLERGTYDLIFYLDGYRTLARRVNVLPAVTIDMNDRMKRGVSIRPEEFFDR